MHGMARYDDHVPPVAEPPIEDDDSDPEGLFDQELDPGEAARDALGEGA